MKTNKLLFIVFLCTARLGVAADIPQAMLNYLELGHIPILTTESQAEPASTNFGFTVEMIVPELQGKEMNLASSVTRIETAGRFACSITTTNGLPFSYMADNLWVGFLDRARPGILVYLTNGNAGWGLRGGTNDTSGVDFDFFFNDRLKEPSIYLNIARVFRPDYWRQTPAYDATRREFRIESKNGKTKTTVQLSTDKSDVFGIQEFRIGSTIQMRIHDIKSKLLTNSLPQLSAKDFDRAVYWAGEATLPTTIPLGFPKDEKEREASLKMVKVLTPAKQQK